MCRPALETLVSKSKPVPICKVTIEGIGKALHSKSMLLSGRSSRPVAGTC